MEMDANQLVFSLPILIAMPPLILVALFVEMESDKSLLLSMLKPVTMEMWSEEMDAQLTARLLSPDGPAPSLLPMSVVKSVEMDSGLELRTVMMDQMTM
jgi:hypothetical protein